jgi:hypothetical protein
MNGKGHVFGPAAIVPVRFRWVSVVVGWSAAAIGATTSSAVARHRAASPEILILMLPPSSDVFPSVAKTLSPLTG